MLLPVVLSARASCSWFLHSAISHLKPIPLPLLHPHWVPELSAALGSAGFLLAHPLSHTPQTFLQYHRGNSMLSPMLNIKPGYVAWDCPLKHLRNYDTQASPNFSRYSYCPLPTLMPGFSPQEKVTIFLSDLFTLFSCFSLSCGVGSCHNQIVRPWSTIEVFTKSVSTWATH